MTKRNVWKSALWYFFCIITMIQMVAMGFYFVRQFGSITLYESTREYIEIATSLHIDEYVGFLYPLILRTAMWLENVLAIRYYQILYVVQLVCAICAVGHFVKHFFDFQKKKFQYLIVVGFLVSIPMISSMYTVIGPVTLRLALWLFLLVSLKQWKDSRSVLGMSLAILLLVPKDFYLLLVIYGALTAVAFVNKTDRKRMFILSLLLLLGGTASVEVMQNGNGSGRMERSFSSAWFLECTTPHFAKDYVCYPEEARAVVSLDEAVLMVRRDDGLLKGIDERLVNAYGRKKTNDFYREMGNTAFRMHTKETIYSLRDDVVQGIFTPFSIMNHKNTGYNSKDGYWYSDFVHVFGNGGKYLYFGSVIVLLVLLLTKGIWKIVGAIKEKNIKYVLRGPGMLIAVGILQVVVSACLDVGAMDYVNYPIMIFVWYFMAVVI